MSYFEVQNLHKEWPGATVDFSYQCERGEMTCLLGKSGSGKSTILNIIAGLEKNDDKKVPPSRNVPAGQHADIADAKAPLCTRAADDGTFKIVLDGRRIESLPARKRGIGMVFQSGALFNHLTVADNVAYGLVSAGVKKTDARARASGFLAFFNLEGMEKRMPQTLSGGEKQRVALARTLITEPKLVLLDEPLSALDAVLRVRLANQIKEWQKEMGFTAIMVTHDEQEAQCMADRIVRL